MIKYFRHTVMVWVLIGEGDNLESLGSLTENDSMGLRVNDK